MAEGSARNPRPAAAKSGTRRRQKAAPADSAGSSAHTRESSDTNSTTPDPANPLGLEHDDWQPPEQPTPADANLELADRYEPQPPELLEWTPERAGAIVRAAGFMLHTADGLSREPEGRELWRATEEDVDTIGPPLARILNRYEPARRLAGVSDEGELAFALVAYTRRNLVDRGRVATAKQLRAAQTETPETWPETGPAAS